MGVEAAKKNFEAAKKAAEDCQASMRQLQSKADTLEESLPGLNRAVEDAEKAKTTALDAFALSSNKQTESALRAARQAHEAAQRACTESNELLEAIARTLKKQEAEFARLNNTYDLTRRQAWEAVADEIRAGIPSQVFEAVKTLIVAGAQCCWTRQFLLDSLFPNIPTDEIQEIRGALVEKHGIE